MPVIPDHSNQVPSHVRVVVVGGGIVGSSVAYHLAKLGWKDITLLEQNALAGGTTWHAAGMVGRLRTSSSMTRINEYSVQLYSSLQEETGHSTGWKQVGSLIVARTQDRMRQLHRSVAQAEYLGVEAMMIDAEAAGEKCSIMRSDDLLGAAWLPGDGKVVPKDTAMALAKGATDRGVQILEGVRVTNVEHRNGRVTGVATNRGPIETEYVVLCGGMWTRELGLKCGVDIPLYPVEHHYAVSNPIEGAWDEMPCTRDPDGAIYFRGEGEGVLLGAFQAYTKPWMIKTIPADFSFQLLEEDWEKFESPLKEGKRRVPALETSGFAKFVNGPESFTPDNQFILGDTPTLRNLYVAAGFNSAGIACAGGAGKVLAEWMEGGEPPMDLWSADIRRFTHEQNDVEYLRNRVTEVLGLHYQMAWPNREFQTGRDRRLSPLHETLKDQGACFGAKMGLERPLFFALQGDKPIIEYAFGFQNWFEAHACEHMAAREKVAIFDQTSFSKFMLEGPDALPLLQRLCGADMDLEIGRITYTGMFNQRGTFESDLSIVRTAENAFYLITATTQTIHDQDWIRRNVRDGEQISLHDITKDLSVISVMGPNSRELLQRVTDADLDDFPFGSTSEIQIGGAMVRAARITYVGELGWELHVSVSEAVKVYTAIREVGDDLGLLNAGHYAINSLRLEKGYRAWGSDISIDDTPLEAGLGFALAWDKAEPFLGREALLRQKETGVSKRMASFLLEDPAETLWHDEPIYRDGVCVGYISSGAYGHALGGAIGLGYVRGKEPISREWVMDGGYEIDVSGRRIPAKVSLRPLYDPKRARILA